ncbi:MULTISPECIES: four-carbon acid sugar kinase family protein [Natrialbaceae]|uniref:four-carbon acid sugar kinase family protein n=1 Tax=Natrialbaceae TaxID=1644061 RepID=UPI00207CC228|nr:four-carbon acid sugar kinase family protein [Natronococcus sp. CG52]
MNVLVVADDFTGAMDTGYGFAADGRAVRVVLSEPTSGTDRESFEIHDSESSESTDVLTIDVDTRDVSPETARKTVSNTLDPNCPLVYKKVDSTLRGNVVPEVDGAIDAIDADIAVVAPAFPSTGRVTANGVHLVDGIPLADAGYNVPESNLRTIFDPSRYRVSTLGVETVVQGSDAVRSALASEVSSNPTIVACDAVHDRHLATIASGAQSLDATVLFVGSGGLASAVSVPGSDNRTPCLDAPDGNILAVVGSVNEATLKQLEAVSAEYIYSLDSAAAVREPVRVGRGAATALADRLAEHGCAVITATTEPSAVERANEAATDLRGDIDAGARVASALAAATTEVSERAPLSSLFLTGGSTARAVLESVSATEIELTGTLVGDGIPEGRICDGEFAGTRVVTKAGGFGTEGSILNCLTYLGNIDERN